jgi:hypothetical protein
MAQLKAIELKSGKTQNKITARGETLQLRWIGSMYAVERLNGSACTARSYSENLKTAQHFYKMFSK